MKKAPAVGPGLGEETSSSPDTPLDREHQGHVDPRLALLLRATAKLHLVEAGYVDLDTAFADLVPAFRQIAIPPCQCEREILASIGRHHLKLRRQWLQAWRWRSS